MLLDSAGAIVNIPRYGYCFFHCSKRSELLVLQSRMELLARVKNWGSKSYKPCWFRENWR